MNDFETKRLKKIISFLNKKEIEKIELSYDKGIIPLICIFVVFNLMSCYFFNIINTGILLYLSSFPVIFLNLFLTFDISKLLRKRLKINKRNKSFSFFKDKNDETIKKIISKFSDEDLVFCHKNKELFNDSIFCFVKKEMIKRTCKTMNIPFEEKFCLDYSFFIESQLKKNNEIKESQILNF